jgi:hypothetical protein
MRKNALILPVVAVLAMADVCIGRDGAISLNELKGKTNAVF